MSVPSKANIDKLDNPARPKANPRAGTELVVHDSNFLLPLNEKYVFDFSKEGYYENI
jgi:hypothetical protein